MNIESVQFAVGVGTSTGTTERSPPRRGTSTSAFTPISKNKFWLTDVSWFLLPKYLYSEDICKEFVFIKYGIKSVYERYRDLRLKRFGTRCITTVFDKKYTKEFVDNFLDAIHKNQTLRWRLKRLIHRWSLSKLRQVNTDDVCTMEPPVKPVFLYDWTNRCKYVFEARTLLQDFRTKLLAADNLFPDAQTLKNPFTNAELTFGQTHFTIQALRSLTLTDWIIEGFRDSKYKTDVFTVQNTIKLKLNALNVLFKTPTSKDCVDIIYDFIEAQHELHDAYMSHPHVWAWFLENKPEYPRILMWRAWCKQYYNALITGRSHVLMDGIERETRELVLLTVNQMRRIYTEESGVAQVTQAVAVEAEQAIVPQAVAPPAEAVEVLITVAEDILM